MGGLIFEITCSKLRAYTHAIISLIAGVALATYCYSYWGAMQTWLAIIISLISVVCLWYTYDRLTAARHNKISFYQKGMVIQAGRTEETLMLDDIKTYKTVDKSDEFEITFIRHNGSTVRLGSDDYKNLANSLESYGQQVNFEIRTKF